MVHMETPLLQLPLDCLEKAQDSYGKLLRQGLGLNFVNEARGDLGLGM